MDGFVLSCLGANPPNPLQGTFGKTYRMKGVMDGQLYAVKMINVKQAESNGVQVLSDTKSMRLNTSPPRNPFMSTLESS